jgi:hypothetical protein
MPGQASFLSTTPSMDSYGVCTRCGDDGHHHPARGRPEALDGYIQVTASLRRLRDALELPIRLYLPIPSKSSESGQTA